MDDEKIIELYFSRDESAISETQKKYGGYLYKTAYGILNNSEDSGECVNDTYLKVWGSVPPNRPEALCAYIVKILRNICISFLRGKNADKREGSRYKLSLDELAECVSDMESPEENADLNALTECINEYLRTLSPEMRQIFICRYFYMDTVSEIADHFGAGQSKVKSALFRARAGLKDHLTKKGFNV